MRYDAAPHRALKLDAAAQKLGGAPAFVVGHGHPRRDGRTYVLPIQPPCRRFRSPRRDRRLCMGFFHRKREAEAAPDESALAALRRPPRSCFACNRARPPFVYAENGHDYCIECAERSLLELGRRPAGHRADDVTLEDLLRLSKHD